MYARKSLRLKGYDYRMGGAYFVTICAHRHADLFGTLDGDAVRHSAIGRIVVEEWDQTADLRPYIELDAFVLMPNHLHGVIVICGDDDSNNRGLPSANAAQRNDGQLQAGSLGAVIGRFKGKVTRRVRRLPNYHNLQVWQRNYFDHIIRSENSLQDIRKYIMANPARWIEDDYYIADRSARLQHL